MSIDVFNAESTAHTEGKVIESLRGTAYVVAILGLVAFTNDRDQEPQWPLGSVMAYAGADPPSGWLIADGRPLLASDYPELYQTISTAHGAGFNEDSTKLGDFNLPDYRGRFLRGVDLSEAGQASGRDPDRGDRSHNRIGGNTGNMVGSVQNDALQRHKHADAGHAHVLQGWTYRQNHGDRDQRHFGILDNTPELTYPVSEGHANLGDPVDSGSGGGEPRLSFETRPSNAAVYWIIRVK